MIKNTRSDSRYETGAEPWDDQWYTARWQNGGVAPKTIASVRGATFSRQLRDEHGITQPRRENGSRPCSAPPIILGGIMTDSESPIFISPGEDPEMEQAAVKARQTFRFFWREMAWEQRRIVPGLDLAAVKASFSDPPEIRAQNPDGLEVEHMWLLEVDFDGRELQGTLINSPHSLQSFSEGERVTLAGKQVCDWMYVIGNHVYGGFTVDLLRSRMEKGERKQHDRAWGFDFGDVGVVNFVPPEYIGEAPAKKKGLLSRFGGSEAAPQDYATVVATEHPMSVNMRESLEQTLIENSNLIHEPDDRGFRFLHQLSLAGSVDGVDVCLKHGADPKKPASNGMTPFALAKVLGWKRVMARLQQAGGA